MNPYDRIKIITLVSKSLEKLKSFVARLKLPKLNMNHYNLIND